jgi:hypothetical protein
MTTTGSAFTTTASTENGTAPFVLMIATRAPFVECVRRLCFVAKLICTQDSAFLTFLRGAFYPAEDGTSVWGPLPSAFVKAGKMLTPASRLGGYKAAAGAMGRSWNINDDCPILGPFFKALRRLGDGDVGPERVVEDYFYRVHAHTRIEIRPESMYDLLAERYKVSREEADELGDLFSKVESVPAFVSHPICHKIAARDYA